MFSIIKSTFGFYRDQAGRQLPVGLPPGAVLSALHNLSYKISGAGSPNMRKHQ